MPDKLLSGEKFFDFTLGTAVIQPFAEGEKKKSRSFQMNAYSGAVVHHPWAGPVVIDLATLEINKPKLPILDTHDTRKIVGYSEFTNATGGRLEVTGKIITVDEPDSPGRRIASYADEGFEWQVSVGLGNGQNTNEIFLSSDQTAFVNGRDITGPCFILYGAVLREVSFCVLGVDENTDSTIFSTIPQKEEEMTEKNDAKMAELEAKVLKAEKLACSAMLDSFAGKFSLDFTEAQREAVMAGVQMSAENLKPVLDTLLAAFSTIHKNYEDRIAELEKAAPAKKDFSKPHENPGLKATPEHFAKTAKNDESSREDAGKTQADLLKEAAVVAAKKLALDHEQRLAKPRYTV